MPYRRAPALTQRRVVWSQIGWLLLVRMTAVLVPALTCRSYRSVSWLTRTAEMASACVFPVTVLVARTFWPGVSVEIGTALPAARSTSVFAVKLSPQLAPAFSAAPATTSPTAFSPAASEAASPAWAAIPPTPVGADGQGDGESGFGAAGQAGVGDAADHILGTGQLVGLLGDRDRPTFFSTRKVALASRKIN
jgi:hypothetical protein